MIARTFDDLSQNVSRVFHETLISHISSIQLSNSMRIVLNFSISLDFITEIHKIINRIFINLVLSSISINIRTFKIKSIVIKSLHNHNQIRWVREINHMTHATLQRFSCRLLLKILRKNHSNNKTDDKINSFLIRKDLSSQSSTLRISLRTLTSTIITSNLRKRSELSTMIRVMIRRIITTTIITKINLMKKLWNLQSRRNQRTFKARNLIRRLKRWYTSKKF